MDIPALSMAMSSANLVNQVGTAMLSKSLDNADVMGEGIKKIMEASVNPAIGQNVDYSI
jgi:hypothetical protein